MIVDQKFTITVQSTLLMYSLVTNNLTCGTESKLWGLERLSADCGMLGG